MIKIKHNIKRTGCTLHGQILDCQFSGKEERGHSFIKKGEYFIISAALPQIWKNELWIWGNLEYNDLMKMSYTYPTEQAAQDMLDFINSFVEKEEPVKEQVEKKYKLIEVGGENCSKRLVDGGAYYCSMNNEDCNKEKYLNCTHGNTLDEIAEKIKKLQEGQDDKSI